MTRPTLFIIFCLAQTAFTSSVQASAWPAEEGAKVPLNAAAIPTQLNPLNESLEQMLNSGAKIVTAYVADNGPVVTVQREQRYSICLLSGADPKSQQSVPTSRCYALN